MALCILNPIYAANRSFYISSFDVLANIDESGNMQVEEKTTYVFDGEFNGIYRNLNESGSAGIDNIQIFDINNKKFENNDTGLPGTYQIIRNGSDLQLKIFSHSVSEIKTFIIKYKVNNVAVKYNDVAELYWKFMGAETQVKIKDFNVTIKLPQKTTLDNIKVFAHGPLSGNISKVDGQTVLLSVKELLPGNFVEARVLFPKEMLVNAANIKDQNIETVVLAEEEEWANEANNARTKAKVAVGLAFVIAFIQILMIAYLYFKYDKEPKTVFDGEYFRELPDKYTPAEMAVLWNFGEVKPRDITATLLDLVRKKYLKMEIRKVEKKGIFRTSVEDETFIMKTENTNLTGLTRHEEHIISWFINGIGDGSEVSLSQITESSKTKTGAESFKSEYDVWIEEVKIAAESYSFFDKKANRGKIIGILVAVSGILYGTYTAIFHGNIIGMVLVMSASILLFIYSLLIKRRSKTGAEQYMMWRAFRKFLKDFSAIDKATMPSVVMWEYYLVYAVSLGVAQEVIKQLKLVLKEEDFNNPGLTFMYGSYFGYGFNHFDTINEVTQSITKVAESTYTQAISQISSASGGGGGFSGGGGGGGGGGGSGAF